MTPAPSDAACVVYLVRHGATANNLARPPRLQGRKSDLELSAEGRRQADRTAAALQVHDIKAVYASPLRRAQETASIIACPHNIQVQTLADLTEVDVGKWEGRQWDEIARSEPDAYRKFMDDPAEHGYVGGEDLAQVRDRVLPALDRLMRTNVGSRIVVVGHNVVNRVFLTHLLGLPISKARGIRQDNCGINVIRFRDGQPMLKTMNAVFHLEG